MGLPSTFTAAILIIGNEILSGRTQDKNVQFIAQNLGDLGLDLREVRVVPDIEEEIIEAAKVLSRKYSYVFTTGGIGPTHDDITTASLAKAFGLNVEYHVEAYSLLEAHAKRNNRIVNEASKKMAYIPVECPLIYNKVSGAPGFIINNNIYVLAGVPNIMQDMFLSLLPRLRSGKPFISKTLRLLVGESLVAAPLEAIQQKYPQISMGSYPSVNDKGEHITSLVLRSNEPDTLDKAFAELNALLEHYPKG